MKFLLASSGVDVSTIDYPAQTGFSLGARGFVVRDYIGWSRIRDSPPIVYQAVEVLLKRIENTYDFLKHAGLLQDYDYATAYPTGDDFAFAYGQEEVR